MSSLKKWQRFGSKFNYLPLLILYCPCLAMLSRMFYSHFQSISKKPIRPLTYELQKSIAKKDIRPSANESQMSIPKKAIRPSAYQSQKSVPKKAAFFGSLDPWTSVFWVLGPLDQHLVALDPCTLDPRTLGALDLWTPPPAPSALPASKGGYNMTPSSDPKLET